MIIIIVATVCVVLGVALNIVLNKCAVNIIKKGGSARPISFIGLFCIVGLFICFCVLPNLLHNKIKYNNFKSYLIWEQGMQTEGAFSVAGFTELDEGFAFCTEDYILSGFAAKVDGKVKGCVINSSSPDQRLVHDDGKTILLFFYECKEIEKTIVVSFNLSGEDFDFSINDKKAQLLFAETRALSKVSVIESGASQFIAVYNSQEFVVKI